MMFSKIKLLITLALAVTGTTASYAEVKAVQLVHERDLIPSSHLILRKALEDARLQDRSDLQASAAFQRSWDGAVLLKINSQPRGVATVSNNTVKASEGVEIICTKCYVLGVAKAELQIPDNFNASDALQKSGEAVLDKVGNITETFVDDVAAYFSNISSIFKQVTNALKDGDMPSIDDFSVPYPNLDLSFNLDVPAIPQVSIKFEFDGLEIYMELDTILTETITYDINIYTQNTPLGIGFGGQRLGLTYTLDLVFSATAAIDIRNGFHIKFEDGLGLRIALFNHSVAELMHNGGKFEMLPVTIESAGVVISAALRLGMRAGFVLQSPQTIRPFTLFNYSINLAVKGGVETSVFANLAEISSNITVAPQDSECRLRVIDKFEIGLGAAAGASIAHGTHTWGPVPETKIPIFTTKLREKCVVLATAATTTPVITSTKVKRADLVTRTTKTTLTYTGVQCKSQVVGACPASLQISSRSTEVKTLTTTVTSGAKVTWPATPGIAESVLSTVAFRKDAIELKATSGVPAAYTAPVEVITNKIDEISEDIRHVDKRLIIGLSVGLGVPALLAVIAIIVFFCFWRRRRASRDAVGLRAGHAQASDGIVVADTSGKSSMVQITRGIRS